MPRPVGLATHQVDPSHRCTCVKAISESPSKFAVVSWARAGASFRIIAVKAAPPTRHDDMLPTHLLYMPRGASPPPLRRI
jgi:hypothetical protein